MGESGEGGVEATGLRGPWAWERGAQHTPGPRYVQAQCRHPGPRGTPPGGDVEHAGGKAPSKTPRGWVSRARG